MFKRLFIIITLVLFMCAPVAALEIETLAGRTVYEDPELDAGNSLELRLKHKGVFFSIGRDDVRKYGADFNIDHVGVGFEKSFWQNFSFFLKGAYYIPNGDASYRGLFEGEALDGKMRRAWLGIYGYSGPWDNYAIEYDTAYGGEVGLSATIKLFDIYPWEPLKRVSVGLSVARKYLKISEHIFGWDDSGAAGVTGWRYDHSADFSGVGFKGLIMVVF